MQVKLAGSIPGAVALAGVVLCALAVGPAAGVVLHPPSGGGQEQVPPGQRPSDAVVGRWDGTGSCVAIGPSRVLTTRHQHGEVGLTVEIDGVAYVVSRYFSHPRADLRLAELTLGGAPANLSEYVEPYRQSDEVSQVLVIGGYGLGRGQELQTDGMTYAYQWAPGPNDTLRWGRNRVDGTSTAYGGYTTKVLVADFDDVGGGGHVTYEAALGDHDSGGGWFVNDGGQWKLAGLSRGVEHFGYSQFRDEDDPTIRDPDTIDAVRVSTYTDWLDYVLAGPLIGDADTDGKVSLADLNALADNYGRDHAANWTHGDFNGDGLVGVADLGALADNYGASADGFDLADGYGAGLTVPEPALMSVLLVGATSLLPRRRRRR